jgi:2,3-bisphosphoglycerate-independent phosphoglycerate mutase
LVYVTTRWDREQKAYNAIRNFEGPTYASAKEGVEANYANESKALLVNTSDNWAALSGRKLKKITASPSLMPLFDLTDEFVEPFIVEGQNNGINDGDAVIFFNFRPEFWATSPIVFVKSTFSKTTSASTLSLYLVNVA